MVDDETILIVGVIVTYLGIHIIESLLIHSENAIVHTKVFLPLIAHVDCGMPHIHITLIS